MIDFIAVLRLGMRIELRAIQRVAELIVHPLDMLARQMRPHLIRSS
jgi:hypothetical protein